MIKARLEKIKPAWKISAAYLLAGVLWIMFSDIVLSWFVEDVEAMRIMQTAKGWFFVIITGLLLFGLMSRSFTKMDRRKAFEALQASEAALKESERQLSTLMANLPGMAYRCLYDREWTIIFASQGCLELTGYKAEALRNNAVISFGQVIHPADRQRVWEQVQAKLSDEKPYQVTYRIITATGKVKWVWEQAVGVYDKDKNLSFIEGFITDITERVNAEQVIKKQMEDLERINAELEQFTYSVSHDLRSPLVTIKGSLNLLRSDIESGNKHEIVQGLERIEGATRRMHQLLEDLLELSRIGRIVNPFSTFQMFDLVCETKQYLHGILTESGATLLVSDQLPSVWGDRSRIGEVLQNLIENAVKFRHKDRPLLIEVGCRNADGEVVFFVRDNGKGIKPEHLEKVFVLFKRFDSGGDGTGLGLAKVKRIIDYHGGRVWAESEGKRPGATFCFTLPAGIQSPD